MSAKITIAGKKYAADFGDLAIIRDLLQAQKDIDRINAEVDGMGKAQVAVEVFENMKRAVERAIGKGKIDEQFGEGALPIEPLVKAVNDLAEIAAPEYDKLLK